MRTIFSFAILFSTFLSLSASSETIKFYDASWSETTAKAKESGKYVFLDCYTDWCYWCKVMDKETFTDTSVSNMINGKFIPAHREMEKSDEGKALCMKYHISGFPTYLIFDGQGQLVYQIIGYRVADEFKKELALALQAKDPLVPGFSTTLDPGFPDFYKKSFGTSKERKKPDTKVVTDWLDKQNDLFAETSWSVMWRFKLNGKYNDWILDNRTKLSALYGASEVDDKIEAIISQKVDLAAETKDGAAFKSAMQMVNTYLPDRATGLNLMFSQTYYVKTGNWKAYADIIDRHIDTTGYRSTSFINGCAWTIYESCDDKEVVHRAAVWMDSVCTATEDYPCEDTYASILYKDGQYKKAEEVAIHAIDLGKTAGEDVSGTEALLANIRLKTK